MKKMLMTASTWGHIRHFHLPYLQAFQGQGWQVHVGCANPPDTVVGADVVIDLPFTKKMTALQNFKVAHQLRQRIGEEGYDLVICHTSLAAFFTRLAVMGMRSRPRIINMVHGYLFDDDTSALKKAIYLGAEQLTAPVTDLVLTMNRWDAQFARQHKLAKEIVNVPGVGVDFTSLQKDAPNLALREQLGIPSDGLALIYPAEFSRRKNQQMLIRAMEKLPHNVYLLLPGRGDLLEDCQRLAQSLGVGERIRFPGFIDGMSQWYHAADVAVSASRSEGLPFNIMEAMACGLPVIASDVKGHQDLIVSGETGLLFPFDDGDAFARGVMQLMEDDQLRLHSKEKSKGAVAPYQLSLVLDQVMDAYGVSVKTPAIR